MGELFYMIYGAALTGFGMAVGGFIVKKASSRIRFTSPDMDYLKKELEALQRDSCRRSEEIKALFNLQGPQIKAMIALLESTKDGHANGKIDTALEIMKQAEEKYHDFLIGGVGC